MSYDKHKIVKLLAINLFLDNRQLDKFALKDMQHCNGGIDESFFELLFLEVKNYLQSAKMAFQKPNLCIHPVCSSKTKSNITRNSHQCLVDQVAFSGFPSRSLFLATKMQHKAQYKLK